MYETNNKSAIYLVGYLGNIVSVIMFGSPLVSIVKISILNYRKCLLISACFFDSSTPYTSEVHS